MPSSFNPFAVAIDPAHILSACSESEALQSLPVSARHSADRSRLSDAVLSAYDESVDQIYAALIEKASKPAAKQKAKA